ncbi:MAG: hypothetical protein CM15mP111_4770 [Hyphomicrobiales bacterium]|nr:MAG: hypothetical protein CM15mP111_4770 [Hyphomicrobiales bacterium]
MCLTPQFLQIIFLKITIAKNNLVNIFTGEQIGQYFQYPEQSLSHSISGTSVIEFYVDTNGSLNDINIVNSLGPQFDRVILKG